MSAKSLILRDAYRKLIKSLDLVYHSARKINSVAPVPSENADAMEPYDALTSRFERSVEVALAKFFRAVEMYEGDMVSDTIRDRLGRMHKLGLISDVEIWMSMRDVRNRIAHDYLPDQIAQIYQDILITFVPELRRLSSAAFDYVNRLPRD